VSSLSFGSPRLTLLEQDDAPDTARKLPDSTEEFSPQDVLDMLEVAARDRSTPSLAPVGIDVEAADAEDPAPLAARRRELTRYVIGAVALACVILVASVAKRTSHADAPSSAGNSVRAEPVTVRTHVPGEASPLTPAVAKPAAGTGAGLIRFATQPGWAWLDGQQLSATSAFVPCGSHQVQIGGEEQHDVDVPCGGEVVVTR
jgi:hypothetical protein